MARTSKWIRGAQPEQPLTKVARRALRKRIKAVCYFAPLAADHWKDDIEYVHQLRVATRRARAATRLFEGLLPKHHLRWLNKQLRELRQAAGNARDLDVIKERLHQIMSQHQEGCLAGVIQQISVQRKVAQKPLLTAYSKAKRKEFKKRAKALTGSVRWPGSDAEPSFGESAQKMLSPAVNDFFESAKLQLSTQAESSDLTALHQMRIAGKKVRYAMELLAGAFEPSFRGELYATFEQAQVRLGTVNDHATAIEMLSTWRERAEDPDAQAALAKLVQGEEQQLNEACQDFFRWWTYERAESLAELFAQVAQIEIKPIRDVDAVAQEKPNITPGSVNSSSGTESMMQIPE